MWIEKASIDGFGRLVRREFAFSKGFNCIYAPNEAGKTTLLEFVVSMLYGQARPGADRRYLDPVNDRYRPWAAGQYAGTLTVMGLSGDAAVLIRRFFDGKADRIELLDATTGKSLAENYKPDRTKELPFMLVETGIDKRTFRSVFVLAHETLSGFDEDGHKAVGDRLVALAETGNERHGAASAEKGLAALIEKIGSDRAATKPFRKTQEAISLTENRLAEVRLAREHYSASLVARAHFSERLARETASLERMRGLVACSVMAALEQLDEEAQGLDERESALGKTLETQGLEGVDSQGLRRAENSVSDFIAVRNRHREKLKVAEAVGEAQRELAGRRDDLSRALEGISRDDVAFLTASPEVRAALVEGKAAAGESVSQARALGARRKMLFTVAIGIALGSVGGAVISLVALEGALAVVAAASSVAAGGALGGLMSFRARRLGARVLEMSAAAEICDKLETDIISHDKRLAAILAKHVSGTRDGVMAAAGDREQKEKELEKARLQNEAQTKELAGIAEGAAAAAVEAGRRLSKLGIAAGASLGGALSARLGGVVASDEVAGSKPDELFSDVADAGEARELFAPLFARTRESDEAASELAKIRAGKETLKSRTRLLLSGRSREAVEKEAGATADRVEDDSLLGEADIPAGRRKVDDAENGINELEVQLADVSARVGEGLKNLPEAAVLEERLESLTRRHRLQTFHRSALEQAARVIKEAAGSFHERIYPEIEKRLGGLLERLTNGVHGGASISCDKDGLPEFNVSDSLKQAPVRPDQLSHGAGEQVYLCARLALAEALSNEGEGEGDEGGADGGGGAPLLLDDPFINYDSQRLEAAVKLLDEAAGTRQIILVTCQDDVRDLAASCGARMMPL